MKITIYPEYQKSTVVDTQLWAQGMPILGNGFFLGINADTDSDVDDLVPGAAEIAWRMTASGLKQAMLDMYEGELVVMGDPSVKPHDRMLITDLYEEMQGGAWVESVVHSFNAHTGFTTSLYADCINEIDDRFEKQNELALRGATSTAIAAYVTPVVINQALFNKNMRRINNMIMETLLKGGLHLEANKTKLIMFFNAMNIKVTSSDINFIDLAIKASNAFDWVHLQQFGQNRVQLDAKDKQTLRSIVSHALQSFYTKDGHAFVNVLLTPFTTLSEHLKPLTGLTSVTDIGKLLVLNANALQKTSGSYLNDTVKATHNAHLTDDVLAQLLSDSVDYDTTYNRLIGETFELNDFFINNLDELADYVLEADMPDHLKAYAHQLKDLKVNKMITSADDLKEIGEAIKECASVCTDTALLSRTATSFGDIKDFSSITKHAGRVRSFFSNIDNLVATVGAVTGPLGLAVSLVYTALEFAVSVAIGAYATEFVERYLQNLQVMRIYPLSKNGRVMVAGITGHKGLVVGSPTEEMQGAWTEFVAGLFGAKEPSNFVMGLLQTLFLSERARENASKYRINNHVPDVLLSGYDFSALQAEFESNFNTRMARLSVQNPFLKLSYERYADPLVASQYFYLYAAKSYASGTGIDLATQNDFIPIASYLPVARYQEEGILLLNHDLLRHEIVSFEFGDDKIEMCAIRESNGKLNVPMLREETLLILERLIGRFVELATLNKQTLSLQESIESHQLFLTSATIIDFNGYDGTGFVFRITSGNLKLLEEACLSVKEEANATHQILDYAEQGNDLIVYLGIPKP